MKITKPGKLPNPKTYKGHCPNCNTSFIATATDFHTSTSGNYTYVKCPLDGCYNHIYKGKLERTRGTLENPES